MWYHVTNEPIGGDSVENKQFKVRMPEEFHNELKVFCVKNNISMQEFTIQAIEEKIGIKRPSYERAV